MENYNLNYLEKLEAESIYIIRETVASFKNPVMLYSVGKDSSVMLRLAEKAFYPNKIPFPLLHVDTGYKFKEMIEFRDQYTKKIGARLIVERNEEMIKKGMHPLKNGIDVCCYHLKTKGLLDAIKKYNFDAAFGGARRDEEKSRAKERIFSHRNETGSWDPKNQRPEPWQSFNTILKEGETMRVFPLSNWTEADVWSYIMVEKIPIVPIYFAQKRKIVRRKNILVPIGPNTPLQEGERTEEVLCRFRSLGCSPCTGAIESNATCVEDILKEVLTAKRSERENRIIDLGSDSAMEDKKKEGYF